MRVDRKVCVAVLAGLIWAAEGRAEGTQRVFVAKEAPWSAEVQANILVNPVGVMYGVSGEFGLKSQMSLEAGLGGYSYDLWDGDYHEWGGGTTLTAIGRFYSGAGMEGLYWGAGLAIVSGWFGFDGWATQGDGTVTGVAPVLSAGYKKSFPGTTLAIEPKAVIAYLVGDNDSDMDLLAGVGVGVGLRF